MTEQLDEQLKVTVDDSLIANEQPQSIGNYAILREIGRGGMGAVYEAEHKLLQKKFALKILSPDRIPDKTLVERFRAEAKAISALEHRGLLRIYEFGISDKGQPFFVTDLFDGKPLSQIVREKKDLPTSFISQVMLQASTALAHAHERGVVHRDIKPSNILVKEEHGTVEVKIIDFGIAKQDKELADGGAPTLTATGEIIGTPQYMSPEQCQGIRLDARSDIYSLGCVFYEILSGQPPFDGANLMNIMFQHLSEGAKPLHFKDKVRQSLAAITMRCLAKDRDKRYQSMEELIADLNAVAEGANIRLRRYDKRKSTFRQRLGYYVGFATVAVLISFASATYMLWAPNVVLYMNLPQSITKYIMDPNQAEAIAACNEADRLRNQWLQASDKSNMQKLVQAETILRPCAEGAQPWNAKAALQLITILAIEGKTAEADAVITTVSGNDPLAIASNTHNVASALISSGFPKQAYPYAVKAHASFAQLVGEKDPRAVKDMWNMAAASYDSGERKRALAEFKAARPLLHLLNPDKTQDCDEWIKYLETTP